MIPFEDVEDLVRFANAETVGGFGFMANFRQRRVVRAILHCDPPWVEVVSRSTIH
jgi:hypothetical protein